MDPAIANNAIVRRCAQKWRYKTLRSHGRLPAESSNPFRSQDASTALSFVEFLKKKAMQSSVSRPMPTIKGLVDRAFGGAFKSFKRKFCTVGLDAEARCFEIFRDEAAVTSGMKPEKSYVLESALVADIPAGKYKKFPHVISLLFSSKEKLYLAVDTPEDKRNWFRVLKLYSKQGNLTHPLIDISETEIFALASADFSPDNDGAAGEFDDDLGSPTSQAQSTPPTGPPVYQLPAKADKRSSKEPAPKAADEIARNFHAEFYDVFDREDKTFADSVAKGVEMNEVMGSFVSHATDLVKMLVDQLCLPEGVRRFPAHITSYRTTADPDDLSSEGMVDLIDSRSGVAVRFDSGDILLRPADDMLPYELSARLNGMEVRCNTAFLHTLEPKSRLRVPLMCVVDYKGHRCMCTASPPFDVSQDLAFGFTDVGDYVVKPEARRLLRATCRQLNLAGHKVFFDALQPSTIHASIETQVYRGADGRFYVSHVARTFPPDASYPLVDEGDPVFSSSGRSPVVHTRVLRPELVARLDQPLSSDAFRNVGGEAVDRLEHIGRVRRASIYLHDVVIHDFVRNLDESVELDDLAFGSYTYRQSYSGEQASQMSAMAFNFSGTDIYDGAVLCRRMHEAGINVRYLGELARKTRLPHIRQICEAEMIARVLKREHGRLLRELTRIRSGEFYDTTADTTYWDIDVHGEAVEATVDLFNLVLGNSLESVAYWTDKICTAVSTKFHYPKDVLRPAEIHSPTLFAAMQRQLGVRFMGRSSYDWASAHAPLTKADFVGYFPRLKIMNHGALFVDRLRARIPQLLLDGRTTEALQAYNIVLHNIKQLSGLCSLDAALLVADIAYALGCYGFPDVASSFLKLSLGILKHCCLNYSLNSVLIYATVARVSYQVDDSQLMDYAKRVVQLCTGTDLFPLIIKFYLALVDGDPLNRRGRNFEFLRIALRISESCLGLTHPITALLYERLGSQYLARGQFLSEALSLFRRTLGIQQEYKRDLLQRIESEENNADSLSRQKGAALLEIDLASDNLYEKYAEALYLSGARGECIEAYEMCVRIREKKYGSTSKMTLESLRRLAAVCEGCGDYRKGVVVREGLLKVFKALHQQLLRRAQRVQVMSSMRSRSAGLAFPGDDDDSDVEVEVADGPSVLDPDATKLSGNHRASRKVNMTYGPVAVASTAGFEDDLDLLNESVPSIPSGSVPVSSSNAAPKSAASASNSVDATTSSDKFAVRLQEIETQISQMLAQIQHETAYILRMQITYLPLDQRAMVEAALSYYDGLPIRADLPRNIIAELYSSSPSEVLFSCIKRISVVDAGEDISVTDEDGLSNGGDRETVNPLFTGVSKRHVDRNPRIYARDAPMRRQHSEPVHFEDKIAPLYEELAVLHMLAHGTPITTVHRGPAASDSANGIGGADDTDAALDAAWNGQSTGASRA